MFDYPPFLEFTRPRGAPGSNYPKLSGNSVPRGSKLTAVRVINRATRFFGGFTSHLFLESLGYVCVALKRIWLRVVIFRSGLSVS